MGRLRERAGPTGLLLFTPLVAALAALYVALHIPFSILKDDAAWYLHIVALVLLVGTVILTMNPDSPRRLRLLKVDVSALFILAGVFEALGLRLYEYTSWAPLTLIHTVIALMVASVLAAALVVAVDNELIRVGDHDAST